MDREGALTISLQTAALTEKPLPEISAPLPDSDVKGVLVWGMGSLDYVAEEYFVYGLTDVVEPLSICDVTDMSTRSQVADERPAHYQPVVLKALQPYRTRIIVSRPVDPARFSGNMLVEFSHPSKGGQPATWGNISKFLARNGDVHVSVQHPLTFPAVRAADPERYGGLEAAHLSQGWGMMAQIGWLLKAGDLPATLAPFRARRLYQAGYSMTGLAVANFANFFHGAARMADGAPVFDAYMPMTWNAYMRPLDVPVLQINSQCEITQLPERGDASRREDSDDPANRYRLFEVAGAPHINLRPKDGTVEPARGVPYEVDWGGPRLSWTNTVKTFPPGAVPNDLPIHLVITTMFDHLKAWVDDGIAPPRAPRLRTGEGFAPVLDADGNPMGGLRLPQMDVPSAVRGVGSIHDDHVLFSYMLPFTPDVMKARHGSHEAYVDRIRAASAALVESRLLAPYAADDLNQAAERSTAF